MFSELNSMFNELIRDYNKSLDDIVKLKALCIQCKKSEAIFTYRLTNDKEQTIVGGTESYCALCRNCYNNSFYHNDCNV